MIVMTEMTERCDRCNRLVRAELAAALHRVRGEQPVDGWAGPDLTGLAVRVLPLLDTPGLQVSNTAELTEAVFAEAFTQWTGIAPATFVQSVQHLLEDLPGPELDG